MTTVSLVYLVSELHESPDERPVILGIFTDLYMAMCAFNLAVNSFNPGTKQYFSGGGDIARVEVTDGPHRGHCWIVERLPLTTKPDSCIVEHCAGNGRPAPVHQ